MPTTWSLARAKNWSVLPPFIQKILSKHWYLYIPGVSYVFQSCERCWRLNQGGRVFLSFAISLSTVRVPASPAGSRNREFILESGTSRQLWESSGGRRRGAQCQWQRGKHSSRGGKIPLTIMIVSMTLVSGNFWFKFFAVLTRMYIRN